MKLDHSQVRNIAYDIEDEIGADFNHIFSDERRRFPVEAVIYAVALAIITSYVVSFIGVTDIAKKHRHRLANFIKRLREQDISADQIKSLNEDQESHLKDVTADANLEELATLTLEHAENNVREFLQTDLRMPPNRAESHARQIAIIILEQDGILIR